jgi:hypothetical protein
MKENDLIEVSMNLRRKLFTVLKEFWEDKKDLSQEHVFFINSTVISSLIAQITYFLFKKDIGSKPQLNYIDDICQFAKQQLVDGLLLNEGE